MPRTSEPCPYCDEPLNIGTHGRFLDADGHPVTDWRDAHWKTCPGCSAAAGAHVFLRFPDAYGTEATRTLNGEEVPENNCTFHRPYRSHRQLHAGERNDAPDQWECSPAGVVRHGASTTARTARQPAVPSRARAGGLDDAPWSDETARGAVRYQVGMDLGLMDPEGGRRLVTHFQRERNPEVRRRFLATRAGTMTCDACGVDLGERYGRLFSEVLEVHHEIPVAEGEVERPAETLRLLCPTCHRVAHYRQEAPRSVWDVARLVSRQRR